jgi:pimeloyl-ACP methyl ester carboxylesterase
MVLWGVEFCGALAARGHHVIRFDNRDVGLSTKFEEAGTPDVIAMMTGQAGAGEPPYTLGDMANDAVGLLDALGIESAHICGASMGGMIVQTIALDHRDRVRSLTSIMSTTGNPDLPPADPAVAGRLMMPPAESREEAIDRTVETFKVIGGPGFEFDEAGVRERAALSYDRCFLPSGQTRQLVAVLRQPNRVPALRKLDLPSLVIHGTADPLVSVAGGKDTADAIPGSELLLIEGMGHDIPKGARPQIVDAITTLTERADA